MGPSCSFSALDFRSRFSKLAVCIASLLILLVALPPEALAKAKPLNAATVHARVLKRGIDNPIAVETSNGVELIGRIIAINTDSFTLQLFNDPEPVTIDYADVIDLRTGPIARLLDHHWQSGSALCPAWRYGDSCMCTISSRSTRSRTCRRFQPCRNQSCAPMQAML